MGHNRFFWIEVVNSGFAIGLNLLKSVMESFSFRKV